MQPPEPRKLRTVDVRPVIASGGQPFPRIMKAVATMTAGEGLLIITPFLPSPLIEKLKSEGLDVRPERRTDGSWQTQVSRLK